MQTSGAQIQSRNPECRMTARLPLTRQKLVEKLQLQARPEERLGRLGGSESPMPTAGRKRLDIGNVDEFRKQLAAQSSFAKTPITDQQLLKSLSRCVDSFWTCRSVCRMRLSPHCTKEISSGFGLSKPSRTGKRSMSRRATEEKPMTKSSDPQLLFYSQPCCSDSMCPSISSH